jgi:hypothetical protein
MICCTNEATWVSDTELWLLEVKLDCWLEVVELEELELEELEELEVEDMALITAASTWEVRAASTCCTIACFF